MNTLYINNNSIIFASDLELLNTKTRSDDKKIDEDEEKKWVDFDEAAAEDEDVGSVEEEGAESDSSEDGDFDEEV